MSQQVDIVDNIKECWKSANEVIKENRLKLRIDDGNGPRHSLYFAEVFEPDTFSQSTEAQTKEFLMKTLLHVLKELEGECSVISMPVITSTMIGGDTYINYKIEVAN